MPKGLTELSVKRKWGNVLFSVGSETVISQTSFPGRPKASSYFDDESVALERSYFTQNQFKPRRILA
jgi:hypothetical protein